MIVLRPIKRILDRLFHVLCRFAFRFSSPPTSDTVLLVRTDGIGDMVYFARYLEAIREAYRGSKLVLCCRAETAELARAMPLLDDIIEFQSIPCRRNYLYRLHILMQVRSLGPKTTVYASYHREHIGDEIALLSGAKVTIAFSGNDECIHPSMRRRNNVEFSTIIDVPDHIPEHFKYSRLLEAIGHAQNSGPDDEAFTRVFVPHRKINLETLLPPTASSRYAIVAPGASASLKRWPTERFAKLADSLVDICGICVVLCGNKGERALLHDVAHSMRHTAVVCSELSLDEAADLVKRATCFVGNDSGLLHLAASFNIPSVGILGGGHFNEFFPYGSVRVVNHQLECYECNLKCKYPEPYCITDISVDDVLRGVTALHLKY